jgi:hypothetical protein
MDKAQKPSNSEWYMPSEPFRIYDLDSSNYLQKDYAFCSREFKYENLASYSDLSQTSCKRAAKQDFKSITKLAFGAIQTDFFRLFYQIDPLLCSQEKATGLYCRA